MHTDTPRRNSYSKHSTEHTPVRQSLCVRRSRACGKNHNKPHAICISNGSWRQSTSHTSIRATGLLDCTFRTPTTAAAWRMQGERALSARTHERRSPSAPRTSPPARTHAQPSRSPTGGGPSHEINCKYVPRARPEPSRSLSLGASSRRRKGTNAVLLTASRRATSSRQGRRRSGSSCCSCRRQKPPCSSRCS